MKLRLIVLSFLMLFVELALIRWTGSNVVFLSYFSNFVLLGSFLGIGIGFLRADSKLNLFPYAPVALAFLVAFVTIFPVTIDRSGSELLFFGGFGRSGLPIWATLPLVFLAVALTMAMIAEGVARTFKEFEPLEAYRLDILGSLGGIVAFSILSFAGAPPAAWGVVVVAVFIWLLLRESRRLRSLLQIAAVVAIAGMLTTESMEPGDSWSPYYKVQLRAAPDGAVWVFVNGIPHQLIQSIEARREREPFYFLPYERRADPSPPEDVLIVGAGTGTDVAIALSEGAGRVDAVEIDPKLQEFGEQLHPDRPYQDERVHAVIDDGRAFLERSNDRYDLIVFALPDSLTLVSGQSSLRLESYLFTLEAFREARDHLKPGGVFAMYNYYREPWLVDRLAGTLAEAFGTTPCVDSYGREAGGLAVLAAGEDQSALRCDAEWQPSGPIAEPATDDHPFVYLQNRGIPAFYLTTIGLILVASLAMVRVVAGPIRRMRTYADLFFMGAAFLLLETKNVVQFALLFGTTWFVNALVFAGILLTVLAAVEVARRVKFARPARLYLGLLLSLAVAWAIPSHTLLELPAALRFVSATMVAFTPVFLANLVFAERFRAVSSSTVAFGANLLGAMVGGVLEYSALVIGYRALLVLAAALYGLAFLAGRHHLGKEDEPEPVPAPSAV